MSGAMFCSICGVQHNSCAHRCRESRIRKIDKEGHKEYNESDDSRDSKLDVPKNVEDVVDEIDSEND